MLDRQTIRTLSAQELRSVDGGQRDPTLGICGTSRGNGCNTNFFSCTFTF
jgi:hypothetical protein